MKERFFSHKVEVFCDPKTAFEYITDSNKWHEWYPAALPTTKERKAEKVGQKFFNPIRHKPISFLPFTIDLLVKYIVADLQYPSLYRFASYTDLIEIIATFRFEQTSQGTLIHRDFKYRLKGCVKYISLFSAKQFEQQSIQAMSNLKARLEAKN